MRLRFRCAYRPNGNGIVERNHRTVKRTAARAGITPEKAAYWYNATSMDSGSRPCDLVFRHAWRLPEFPQLHSRDESRPLPNEDEDSGAEEMPEFRFSGEAAGDSFLADGRGEVLGGDNNSSDEDEAPQLDGQWE